MATVPDRGLALRAGLEENALAGRAVRIEPLRDGDVDTVAAVVEQLGVRSRHLRFGKLELRPSDLASLASVGDGRRVLVARVGTQPVAIAQLVRDGDPSSAEAAIVVADAWQGRGIGRALARRLAGDAAAAGITRVHALIGADNRPSLALMRGATRVVDTRFEGRDVVVVGDLALVHVGDDGTSATWLDHVTDDEYGRAPAAA